MPDSIAEASPCKRTGAGRATAVGLFWNEDRTAQTAESLAEGETLVVDIDPGRIDPANEGKLIHVTGTMKAGTAPNDTEFGVSAEGLKLVRTVEMYQWEEQKEETRKNVDGTQETVTTYSYVRGWSPRHIDSSRFKVQDGHYNPAIRYRGAAFMGGDVTLGAFRPGKHVVGRLPVNQEVRVNPPLAETLSARLKEPIQVNDGKFNIGRDPSSPQIGDIQVSYTLAPAGAVSVIGQQSGSDFVEYQTRAGDRLLMVEPGTISTTDMFKQKLGKVVMTWIIRLGALIMFFGFLLILNPLVVVADVVPLIGNIFGAGALLISLIATLVLASLVIAIPWLWYRPVVSIAVITVGAALAIGLTIYARHKAAARIPAPAPAPV